MEDVSSQDEDEGNGGNMDREKPFKRRNTSSIAEVISAFRYRSPGRRTLADCSLTSVVTPERISSELVQCAREGDAESLHAILTALGKELEKFVNTLDEQGLTPLHYACQYDHPDVVDILLHNKADVNVKGDEDATPAHYCAMPKRGKKPSTDRAKTPEQAAQAWIGVSCVPKLKEARADFRQKDIYGQTPLHYAAIHGNVTAAKDILAFNDKEILEAKDNQEMRALHVAALYNELGVAKLLLEAGAEVLCDDHENSTPLHHACSTGNIILVKMLIEFVSKVDKLSDIVSDTDVEGSTCLHLAVENGHVEIATLLIEKGCDVNKPRSDGMLPLHLAVISGKSEIVRLLIDKKARIDAGNGSQATALHKAAQYDKVKAAKLLLRRGANLEALDRDNDTPLLIASMYGQVDMVKLLLKKGADVTATNLKEKSAIYVAAEEGNVSVLQALFEVPLTRDLINWGDRNGNTALHIAAQKKSLLVVKILLQNKAYVHSKNELEEAPLHWAARHGNANAIREIVKTEQNTVFAEDEKSNTPLHFAALYGHSVSVSTLLDLGADVGQKNCVQWTALDMAASVGWSNTCKVLLEADSPVDPMDKRDATPLHHACREGHYPVVAVLLKWNADVTKRDRNGMNCLDLAIVNNNSDIARQIVQSNKWKEALRHARIRTKRNDVIVDTPMRRLIKKMPDVAKEVFDRCVSEGEEKDTTDKNYEQHFNFEFIDDLYASWTQPEKKTKEDKDKNPITEKLRHLGKKKYKPYTTKSKTIMENHPLTIMVTSNQEHLLAHPLVTALLSHKWWSFGAWYYLYSLILHVTFVAFLTAYSLNVLGPHKTTVANVNAIKADTCSAITGDLHQEQYLRNERYVLMFLVTVCILNELFQMYQSKWSYFSINNITEWATYIFTILVLIDFNGCQNLTGLRYEWQWSLAAVAVFLGWTDLMLFIQGFSSLGIYVVMFKDILITFLKAITVFFVLIMAFAMGFCILLQNQIPFRNVGSSLLKTFVMIIGEFDFNDIFNAGVQSQDSVDQLYYPEATSLLFVSFVVLSSIVLMNLLVGLAVDDIKGILRQAALKRRAMQVQLTMDVEKVLPDFVRQRFFLTSKVVKPNMNSHRPVRKVYMSIASWWETNPEEDEDAVLREIPEIRKMQEKMKRDIKEIKRVVQTVREMHVQNKHIKSMLTSLLKQNDNVSWIEEDFSTDDERPDQSDILKLL